MHRVLERLDAAGSTLVPLLYLAGLTLGTLSYFTGVTADLGVLAVGIGLAGAAELHSFLQQRRVRASWALVSRVSKDDPRRVELLGQLRVNVAILVALVAFSSFNAIAFAAATWHPATDYLPRPVQIAVRGLVIPVFFLLAGFLAPLQADAGALLASASHNMLHKAITATTRQWRKRVNKAERAGLDLAPVAVALMLDAGDQDGARRVQLIASGLDAAEGRAGALGAFEGPPDGPGGGGLSKARRPRADVLRLTPPTVRMRVQDVIDADPGATVADISRRAHVSLSAASKWRGVIDAERAERQEVAQ